MSVNRKVYLSINGQAHAGDISLITEHLSRRGFEVVKHSTGGTWIPEKITESNFMIILPSPYLYKSNRSMWIIGKGQWDEIQKADEEGMSIYVKDIKTGLLYPYEDVFMIEQKKDDWINYAVIDVDMSYDLDVDDLFGENYPEAEYFTNSEGKNHFTTDKTPCNIPAKKYPKSHTQSKAATTYPLPGTSVLGRPKKRRSFE